LLISFVEELVDHAHASLLFDPNLLRFLLFSEELVIYFPAHCVLHRDRTNGMTTPQYRPQFQSATSQSFSPCPNSAQGPAARLPGLEIEIIQHPSPGGWRTDFDQRARGFLKRQPTRLRPRKIARRATATLGNAVPTLRRGWLRRAS
jgi:hypothetical protein